MTARATRVRRALYGPERTAAAPTAILGSSTSATQFEALRAFSELPEASIIPERARPSILMIDIEVAPALVMLWDIWNPKISPHTHIVQDKEMICFAAKWLGEPGIAFRSTYHDGKFTMLQELHGLLEEADAVMHWNGVSFDMPWINTELFKAGFSPPSPYKNIDLYLQFRKIFNFTSNSMDFITKALGYQGKEDTRPDWKGILNGDKKAWDDIKIYNTQDVLCLEDAYGQARPWLMNHPSFAVYSESDNMCPNCGSESLEKRGKAYTAVSVYQRYHCTNPECGKWSRSTSRETGVKIREVAS